MSKNCINLGGNLWIERHKEHVYIKDGDTEDTIALYVPQGDCELVANTLLGVAADYAAEQQAKEDRDKLARLVDGRGLSGEEKEPA